MQQIRSSNTKPELLIRRFLHAHGFRYSPHSKKLPGKPEIVRTKYRAIILCMVVFGMGILTVNIYVIPKTRTGWWLNNINTNKANDSKAFI